MEDERPIILSLPTNQIKPKFLINLSPIISVLKKVQRPKKSLKLFLGRYQNHSKSGFFYENHQPEVIQRLKMNDQSS